MDLRSKHALYLNTSVFLNCKCLLSKELALAAVAVRPLPSGCPGKATLRPN